MAGRIREGDNFVEKAEIDVMLVLLIIFMVAAPLSTVDVRSICPAPPPNPPSARLTEGAFDHANLAVDITGQIEAARRPFAKSPKHKARTFRQSDTPSLGHWISKPCARRRLSNESLITVLETDYLITPAFELLFIRDTA